MAIIPLLPSSNLHIENASSRIQSRPGAKDRSGVGQASPTAPEVGSFRSEVDRHINAARESAATHRHNHALQKDERSRTETDPSSDAYSLAGSTHTVTKEATTEKSATEGRETPGDPKAQRTIKLSQQTARLAEIARALKGNALPPGMRGRIGSSASETPATQTEQTPAARQPLDPSQLFAIQNSETASEVVTATPPSAQASTMEAAKDGKAITSFPSPTARISDKAMRAGQNPDLSLKTDAPQEESPGKGAEKLNQEPPAKSSEERTQEPAPLQSAAKSPTTPDVPFQTASNRLTPLDSQEFRSQQQQVSAFPPVMNTSAQPTLRSGRGVYQQGASIQATWKDQQDKIAPSGKATLNEGTVFASQISARAESATPTAATSGTVPAREPVLGAIIDQVKQTLQLYPEKNSATFDVRPAELGKISIEIVMGPDNTAHTIIHAHTAQGQEALQRNAAQLRVEFERQGLPQPDLSFNQSNQGGHENAQEFMSRRQQQAFGSGAVLSDGPESRPTFNRAPMAAPRSRGLAVRGASGRINLTI